jgi:HD-like signal output (HDOD) protein
MTEIGKMSIQNIEDWRKQIAQGGPFHFTWKYLADQEFMNLASFLQSFLSRIDRLYLFEAIFIILKEMLINANRAIAKRVFLEREKVDPNNSKEYNEALVIFKEEIINKWAEFKPVMEKGKYFVELKIFWDSKRILFEVCNNSPMLPIEQERVKARMDSSDRFKTILDAYKDVSDSQESAGLGIIMSILLLRNVGLGKENLQFFSDMNFTRVQLDIPTQIIPHEITSQIKEKIIKEVEVLPSFPESLSRIITICRSPNMEIKQLVDEIEKNPAVAADVLKISNSAGYINRAKSTDLNQAVRKIGSNGILRILYAISSVKIMRDKFGRMEKEWEHARRTSFYSDLLLKHHGLSRYSDSITMGALLHDIGKILLLAVESVIFPQILSLTKNRSMENTKVLEEATIGVSHSELGVMLSNKWNFPIDLSAIIEFHQQPYMAPEEYRIHAEVVYLANMMANCATGEFNYYSLDEEILLKYEIYSESEFKEIVDRYEKQFKKEEAEDPNL